MGNTLDIVGAVTSGGRWGSDGCYWSVPVSLVFFPLIRVAAALHSHVHGLLVNALDFPSRLHEVFLLQNIMYSTHDGKRP